MSEEDVQKD